MTLTHQLNSLEASGLILLAQTQPELEYLFRHALVQEAAYGSLVRLDRRMLHQAVGQALERLHPARLDSLELAPVLARHFAEAGDRARALRYYTRAARGAAAMYANAEAILLYTQAIELAQALHTDGHALTDLFLERGHRYELNAQDAEAIANYEALAAWGAAAGDQAAQLAAIAACATVYVKPSIQQNLQRAYDLSQQALTLARTLGDPAAEAKAHWNLMQYHLARGDLPAALGAGERALAIARQHNLREQLAYVLTDLTKVYFQVDQPGQSKVTLDEAAGLWRELGVLNMLADNLATMSMIEIMSGNFALALEQSDEAERISRQIGNQWNEAYAHYLQNLVYFEHGDIAQAIASAETCRRLSDRAGFAEGVNQASFDLAMIYGDMGAVAHAREAAAHLLAGTDTAVGVYPFGPQVVALEAMLYFFEGQAAKAQAVLDEAKLTQDGAPLKNQFVLTQVLFALVLSELALARGEAQAALALAQGMHRNLRHLGVRLFGTDALLLQGRALRALGQPAEAQTALETARLEAEDLGSRRTLWAILAELAELAAERGETEAARALRQAAIEHIDYIAAHTGDPELAQSFRSRPAVRAVLEAAGRTTPLSAG